MARVETVTYASSNLVVSTEKRIEFRRIKPAFLQTDLNCL